MGTIGLGGGSRRESVADSQYRQGMPCLYDKISR